LFNYLLSINENNYNLSVSEKNEYFGFIRIMFIIYSIIQFLDDNTSGGTISIIIDLSLGASYLKYVSNQTVKTTKK